MFSLHRQTHTKTHSHIHVSFHLALVGSASVATFLLLLVLFSVNRKMFALKLETKSKVGNIFCTYFLFSFASLASTLIRASARSMKMLRKLFIGNVSASKRRSNNLRYFKIYILGEMFSRNDVWASIRYLP